MFQGHAVDAVIMPVAPHAAVIPGKFYHTGEFWMCSRVINMGNDVEWQYRIYRSNESDELFGRRDSRHTSR